LRYYFVAVLYSRGNLHPHLLSSRTLRGRTPMTTMMTMQIQQQHLMMQHDLLMKSK